MGSEVCHNPHLQMDKVPKHVINIHDYNITVDWIDDGRKQDTVDWWEVHTKQS